MSKSFVVKVQLILETREQDGEELSAVEVIREAESFSSGGDFTDSAAILLYEKCIDAIQKTNPV